MKKTYDHERRNLIISKLWEQQGNRCALSGERRGMMDAHEWLVPRNAYPFPSKQNKIFTEINMIVISRAEHLSNPILRDYRCAKYKLQWYNPEQIEEWLQSLNLRTGQTFKQWIEYKEHILKIPKEQQIKL